MERSVKGIWIPIEIWNDDRLTIVEKGILAEIDSLDGENHCYASNEHIAEFCHCTERTVSAAITKLIELGYVSKISFDGRKRILASNIHTIVSDENDSIQDGNKERITVETASTQGRNNFYSESKMTAPALLYNINNIDIEKTNKKTTQKNTLEKQHSTYPTEFETFWNAYPRHTNTSKKETYIRFCKALTKTDLQTILNAIECQKKTKQWIDGYIPMPTTWLNKEKWNDEVEEYTGSTKLPTKTYTEDQTPWKAANWLSKKINKMHPSIQEVSPETLQMWASVFDKMETEDKHSPEEILVLMRFAFQDNFWNKNISTPMDLKKNYVKILAKAESEGWFN